VRGPASERVRQVLTDTVALGQGCREAIGNARRCLAEGDEVLALRMVAADQEIDRRTATIEAQVLLILTLTPPLAGDLRRVVAVFKCVTDLERIGDYAVHAARAVVGPGERRAPADVVTMAGHAEAMVTGAVDALAREDADLAREVIRRDDRVDRLLVRLRRASEGEAAGHPWLAAARSLERAADHAVNVAQWAAYAAEGERPTIVV